MTNQINDISGIDLSVFNKSFADKTIAGRMDETKCNSFNEYIEYLKSNNTETDRLKKVLNNNFSEFFRNPLTFAVLERIIKNGIKRIVL